MKFELLPYDKDRKGATEAPIIWKGNIVFTPPEKHLFTLTHIEVLDDSGDEMEIEISDCQQLYIEELCKSCEGFCMCEKQNSSARHQCMTCYKPCDYGDCHDCKGERKTLRPYTGSKCGECDGEGVYKYEDADGFPDGDDCQLCNGSGTIPKHKEIIELMQTVETIDADTKRTADRWKRNAATNRLIDEIATAI